MGIVTVARKRQVLITGCMYFVGIGIHMTDVPLSVRRFCLSVCLPLSVSLWLCVRLSLAQRPVAPHKVLKE